MATLSRMMVGCSRMVRNINDTRYEEFGKHFCGGKVMERKIERKFWSPSVTSQFRICPIPFHFDTYRGCHYGCLFCFARDFIQFQRRNREEAKSHQSYLEGNSPEGLQKWIDKVNSSEYNYNKAEMVAFKERMPIKIGATADPFPLIEEQEHITYDCLKIFDKYDYPVQISTKNPEVFLSYAQDFIGSNIALNVSCSFCDDDIARKIEVGAISPTRRFEAIKKLSEMGFKITVRMQPFILPYSEDAAERFVKKLKDYGVWAFQTEGLKLRVVMPQKERLVYEKIGKVFGFDIIDDFKKNGEIEGGDRVYNEDTKRKILKLYNDLSIKYGVKFFNADNLVDKEYGCSAECCGTECLRDYKIWGGCYRSNVFPEENKYSHEFGKCYVNFTRSTKNKERTIEEVSQEYIMQEMKRKKQLDEIKHNQQLTLF